MIRYSVIVPQRDAGEAFAAQLVELTRVMDLLELPYEILCIDDGSALPTSRILLGMLEQYAQLRVLRFETPQGISAALAAGIAACEGEIVVVVEQGLQYDAEQIPTLISHLSRSDLVCGRRRRGIAVAWLQWIVQVPRRLLLGLPAHDVDCLFWAARHEAVAGIELPRGMFRYLTALVSMRGYRVSECGVDFCRQLPRLADAWPIPLDLLCVWWQQHRRQRARAQELAIDILDNRPRIKLARIDGAEQFHRSRGTHAQHQARQSRRH